MNLSFASVTYCLFCLSLSLLFLYLKRAMKMVKGLPYFPIIPKFINDKVTGKISKDVPFTNYIMHSFRDICMQFEKEGLFTTFWITPVLFIFGDEAIKFFSNDKLTGDKPPEYKLAAEFMGDGLIISNGEKFKTHKKLINPAFHMGELKDKVPLFNEHASELVKDLEILAGNEPVDVFDALKCNYFNALSESVFGLKQSEENKSENLRCLSLIDSLFQLTIKRWLFPWLRPDFFWKFSFTGRQFQKQNKEYKKFITKVINGMKSHVVSNGSVNTDRFSKHMHKSFTYILLNAHLNDPSFTFQDLHDEVSNMLIAGYDTVTYTTLWCLFLLGLHPEIQETAFEEVQSVTNLYITYEDTCNLTYLEAVIMETLRVYPTLPAFVRILSENVQYGKYKVNKGTRIFFIPYIAHRNPDIYPNPENFEPERFLNRESEKNSSFLPFSVGNRSCIGKKFAIIEMKIFLAYILRNFKITSLDNRESIHLNWTVVLSPAKHLRMMITPRNIEETSCKNERKN